MKNTHRVIPKLTTTDKTTGLARKLLCSLAFAAGFASSAAVAETYTWTPTGGGLYDWDSVVSNWTSGFPNAPDDIANLNIDLLGSQTINLNQPITVGAINLGDTTTPFYGNIIAPGIAGSLIMDVTAGSATITRTNGNSTNDTISAAIQLNDDLVVSDDTGFMYWPNGSPPIYALNLTGNISGTGKSVTKNGNGAVMLTGTNTFNGGLTLNSGLLALGNNAVAGDCTLTINGGVLHGTTGTGDKLLNNNPMVWNGPFTLGWLSFNTGTGAVTLSQPITLSAIHAAVVGGTITGPGGLNAFDITYTTASGANSNIILKSPIVLRAGQTINTISDWSVQFDGVISDGGNGYGFTKAGATNGSIILTAAHTYTGDTIIDSGKITLTDTSSLKFKVTDSGSNKITSTTGTGVVTMNGAFDIDTSAVTVPSGTWTLVDTATLTETYGNNFNVTGFTKNGSIWVRTEGGRTWVFNPASGELSIAKAWITSFNYGIYTGVIDQIAKTIALEVPFLTDLSTLNPTFVVSTGTCNQTSGSAPSPTFAAANPVTYTVTDGADVNNYVVTVTVAPLGTGKEITRLYFPGYGYAWATDATHFSMVVPNSATLNGLAPTFTIPWAASADYPSGTARDFTTPQTYRITAEDATFTDYVVTVQKSANVGTGYQARVLADNPVSYWPLNETAGTTAFDLASSLNPMTYGGTYSLNQPGLRPDGNPSVLFSAAAADPNNTRAPLSSSLNPKYAFTVECWVKPVNTTVQYLVSLQDRTTGGRSAYAIWKNNNSPAFGMQWGTSETGTGSFNGTTAIVPGTSYHVVGTYDGSKMRLYVNGVLEGSADAPIYQPASINQPGFTVGSRNGINGAPSYMQDVALYSRALTAEEIMDHWLNPPPEPDSPYILWANQYEEFDLTDPAADLDSDGVTNFEEFAFGLNPTSGASVNPITDISLLKSDGLFSYTRGDGTGLIYSVWASTDLVDWGTEPLAVNEEPGEAVNGVVTVLVELPSIPTGGKYFVRVKAEQAPAP